MKCILSVGLSSVAFAVSVSLDSRHPLLRRTNAAAQSLAYWRREVDGPNKSLSGEVRGSTADIVEEVGEVRGDPVEAAVLSHLVKIANERDLALDGHQGTDNRSTKQVRSLVVTNVLDNFNEKLYFLTLLYPSWQRVMQSGDSLSDGDVEQFLSLEHDQDVILDLLVVAAEGSFEFVPQKCSREQPNLTALSRSCWLQTASPNRSDVIPTNDSDAFFDVAEGYDYVLFAAPGGVFSRAARWWTPTDVGVGASYMGSNVTAWILRKLKTEYKSFPPHPPNETASKLGFSVLDSQGMNPLVPEDIVGLTDLETCCSDTVTGPTGDWRCKDAATMCEKVMNQDVQEASTLGSNRSVFGDIYQGGVVYIPGDIIRVFGQQWAELAESLTRYGFSNDICEALGLNLSLSASETCSSPHWFKERAPLYALNVVLQRTRAHNLLHAGARVVELTRRMDIASNYCTEGERVAHISAAVGAKSIGLDETFVKVARKKKEISFTWCQNANASIVNNSVDYGWVRRTLNTNNCTCDNLFLGDWVIAILQPSLEALCNLTSSDEIKNLFN